MHCRPSPFPLQPHHGRRSRGRSRPVRLPDRAEPGPEAHAGGEFGTERMPHRTRLRHHLSRAALGTTHPWFLRPRGAVRLGASHSSYPCAIPVPWCSQTRARGVCFSLAARSQRPPPAATTLSHDSRIHPKTHALHSSSSWPAPPSAAKPCAAAWPPPSGNRRSYARRRTWTAGRLGRRGGARRALPKSPSTRCSSPACAAF